MWRKSRPSGKSEAIRLFVREEASFWSIRPRNLGAGSHLTPTNRATLETSFYVQGTGRTIGAARPSVGEIARVVGGSCAAGQDRADDSFAVRVTELAVDSSGAVGGAIGFAERRLLLTVFWIARKAAADLTKARSSGFKQNQPTFIVSSSQKTQKF
jgi:hypothetical protein